MQRIARILTVMAVLSGVLALSSSWVVNRFTGDSLSGLWSLICVAACIAVGFTAIRFERASRILERHHAHLLEQLGESQSAAERAQRNTELLLTAQTRMLGVSDSLRQPVQALALFTEVLSHCADEVKRRELISAIERTTLGLSTAIEDLDEVSRVELDKDPIVSDVRALVRSAHADSRTG